MRAHEFILEYRKRNLDWDDVEHVPLDPNMPDDTDVEGDYDKVELEQTLEKVLHTLTAREQKIIILYFGLFGKDEHTYQEIGQIFSVDKERIRLIVLKGLRKLRNPSRVALLKPFL